MNEIKSRRGAEGAETRAALAPNEITRRIVDAAYKLHTVLGPGLLETVYEVALAHDLLRVARAAGATEQKEPPSRVARDA